MCVCVCALLCLCNRKKYTHSVRMMILGRTKHLHYWSVATSVVYVLSDHTINHWKIMTMMTAKGFVALRCFMKVFVFFFMLWLVDGDKL